MKGVKYHSVVIPTDRVLSQCVFFSGCGDPEVYVRPDKTAYCTGFPETARTVTEQPGAEALRPDTVATILKSVRDASSSTASSSGALKAHPVLEQACYLPTTDDGIPIMGRLLSGSSAVPDNSNCYIAAGHGCWGILMGPATGQCMANLIATGDSSNMDLRPFNPGRYKTLTPVL